MADIVRRYGDAYRRAAGVSSASAPGRGMTAIETCRTAALGGPVEACDACGHRRIASNSCANRHCPKCQSLKRAAWVDARQEEWLDVEYFHVVFTVPQDVAALALQNKATVYRLLFRAPAATLRTIAADPRHLGAELGFFAVLHTWGQTLRAHPHLHCVIPGGGLSPDGTQWVACRPGFFLPVRVRARLFRRRFLHHLQAAYRAAPSPSSPPTTMTLAAGEFIRRFLLHVLPAGFHRIRYYGFLGARHRREKLARCRHLRGSPSAAPPARPVTPKPDYRDRVAALTGVSLRVCPAWHHGERIIIECLWPASRAGFVRPDTS